MGRGWEHGSVGRALAWHAQSPGFYPKHHITKLGMWCTPVVAALGRWRQEEHPMLSEFKVSLRLEKLFGM